MTLEEFKKELENVPKSTHPYKLIGMINEVEQQEEKIDAVLFMLNNIDKESSKWILTNVSIIDLIS